MTTGAAKASTHEPPDKAVIKATITARHITATAPEAEPRRKSQADLEPGQKAVLAEQATLDTKTAALKEFSQTSDFAALPRQQKRLMIGQIAAMEAYSNILGQRIALF